jgi:hypothetical protein
VKLVPNESVLQDVNFAGKEVQPLQPLDDENQLLLTELRSKEVTTASVFVKFTGYHWLPFTANPFTDFKSVPSLAEADLDVSTNDVASFVNCLAMYKSRFTIGEQLDSSDCLASCTSGEFADAKSELQLATKQFTRAFIGLQTKFRGYFTVIDQRMLRIMSDERRNTRYSCDWEYREEAT